LSQGITDFGVTIYFSVNDPWHNWNDLPIPNRDNGTTTKTLSTGFTLSMLTFDVVTGGFATFDGSNENKGKMAAIADLLGDGTLNGLNLHPYHGSAPCGTVKNKPL